MNTASARRCALENAPTVILGARITRVAVDHLGVEFNPGQEEQVHFLLDELLGTP